jgi:hypothetical protein
MPQMVGALRDDKGSVLTPLAGIADVRQLAPGPDLPDVQISVIGEDVGL